jgi:TrmH family RNA methyltransferase
MIPLYRLEKLPRTQRLRKIAKVFAMAENRLCQSAKTAIFSESELAFFSDAVSFLAKDALFSPSALALFKEAGAILESAVTQGGTDTDTAVAGAAAINSNGVSLFRRALNSVKHLLLSETGRDQADWDFAGSDGRLDPAKRRVFKGVSVYLEDIRSPFNVGAMFRTAESFGVEKMILSPFCADPHHRRAARTAMGCVDIVPWERRELFPAIETAEVEKQKMPMDGSIPVFALETGGIPLAEFSFPPQGILIAGSEELGVSPCALAAASASLGRVSIPCYGAKASLNVSAAFAIVMQAWAQSLYST